MKVRIPVLPWRHLPRTRVQFSTLDLSRVPSSDHAEAVTFWVQRHTAFAETDHIFAVNGGHAEIWYWAREHTWRDAFSQLATAPAGVFGRTSRADGWHLVHHGPDGDLQRWEAGRLILTRAVANREDALQWLEAEGEALEGEHFPGADTPLLPAYRRNLQWPRWGLRGGWLASLLIVFLIAAETAAWGRAMLATNDLHEEVQALETELAPVISIRDQVAGMRAARQAMRNDTGDPLDALDKMLSTVGDDAEIFEWEWRPDRYALRARLPRDSLQRSVAGLESRDPSIARVAIDTTPAPEVYWLRAER